MSDSAEQVARDWKLVPVKDTPEMWGGLARAIVMWRDMADHSGAGLHTHLRLSGETVPAWLTELIPDTRHSPPKGAVAGAIYRAMVEKAPEPPATALRSSGWRTIDTYPANPDGYHATAAVVDIWVNERGRVTDAHQHEGKWWYARLSDDFEDPYEMVPVIGEPSHWRFAPEPPVLPQPPASTEG